MRNSLINVQEVSRGYWVQIYDFISVYVFMMNLLHVPLLLQMSSSEAELASKQEQLQTITEKLQSFSNDSPPPATAPDNQQLEKLEEKIKEVQQERDVLKKVNKVRGNVLLFSNTLILLLNTYVSVLYSYAFIY